VYNKSHRMFAMGFISLTVTIMCGSVINSGNLRSS